jgi:hypothetical protein
MRANSHKKRLFPVKCFTPILGAARGRGDTLLYWVMVNRLPFLLGRHVVSANSVRDADPVYTANAMNNRVGIHRRYPFTYSRASDRVRASVPIDLRQNVRQV